MDLVLRYEGDPLLKKPSVHIDEITTDILQLTSSMKLHMKKWGGIGLAAPQVGYNIRLLVMRMDNHSIQEMINPRISWTSKARGKMVEGCLSVQTVEGIEVERPLKVRVKFQSGEGKFKYWLLDGLEARIFQHEYDHLEGILITAKSSD